MRDEEYDVLDGLVRSVRPQRTLEIGLANGTSAVVICRALRESGGGKHVAIDPYQSDPAHWDSRGLERVHQAGLADFFELIEDFDYLVLPRLLAEGRSFDFILIDGWHSFDYTLLDLFYADHLLEVGGVIVLHDTGCPAVWKACRFLETHKPYDLVSPPIGVIIPSLTGRALRRARQFLGGRKAMSDARQRRTEWFSLAAYRKLESRQVPSEFFVPF